MTTDRLPQNGDYSDRLPGNAPARKSLLISLIWFICFICFIRLVWFNQINKTNQTNETDQSNQPVLALHAPRSVARTIPNICNAFPS
jgi:hypothetical protein